MIPLLLGLLLAVPALPACVPEPSYAGKSLGQWMIELRTAGLRNSAAATALRAIGPAAIPCLVGYVVDPPDNTPVFPLYLADAFRALGPRAAPAVIPLVRLTRYPDGKVVTRAVNALGAIPSMASTAALYRILDEQRNAEAMRAALVASTTVEVGRTSLVPPLVKALHHSDSGVRAVAAWAIGRIGSGGTYVVPPLVAALSDREAQVRGHAAVALGSFRTSARQSVMPLAGCVADRDPGVRRDCAQALGAFGKKARPAIPTLEKATQDSESSVRSAASYALLRIARSRD